MPKLLIFIREAGSLKPDFSLEFDLPAIPQPGDYISILRPDAELHTEDAIVEQVWWRVEHPETRPVTSGPQKVGKVREIIVECSPAIGPNSRDQWRDSLKTARKRGHVKTFKIARLSVRQDELAKSKPPQSTKK